MKIREMDIKDCEDALDRYGLKNVEDWFVFYGFNGGIAWRYGVINNNINSPEYGRILYVDIDDEGYEEITEEDKTKTYEQVILELKELHYREKKMP